MMDVKHADVHGHDNHEGKALFACMADVCMVTGNSFSKPSVAAPYSEAVKSSGMSMQGSDLAVLCSTAVECCACRVTTLLQFERSGPPVLSTSQTVAVTHD